MLPNLLEVKSLADYSLWLKFEDGVQGEISLKDLLSTEVFSAWKNGVEFSKFYFPRQNVIAWNDQMEVDADGLYLELRGISFEEWKQETHSDAAVK